MDKTIIYELGNERFAKVEPTWQDHPTEDGYYWFNDDQHGIMFAEFRRSKYAGLTSVNFLGNLHDYSLNEVSGKWYGPITPPKE